jgi:trans-aconitate methyltransferase
MQDSASRKDHWEEVYRTRSPLGVSWYQTRPTLSLDMLQHASVGKDARLIDVGGGASVLVDHLLGAGFTRLAVLDIAGAAMAHSRARLGTQAAQVEWYESDVTTFHAPHAFDVWHDRAVFHFLTAASDRAQYVARLKEALVPGGTLIMATFALDGPRRCSDLDTAAYDAQLLSTELGDEFLLREEASEMHVTPANKEQRFAYFRFERRA